MSESPQVKFNNVELNPDLLTTLFRIQTNWHVITGAPSCGKTTITNLLAERGFQVAPEGARLYMEREMAGGRTLEEIRLNSVVTEHFFSNIDNGIVALFRFGASHPGQNS